MFRISLISAKTLKQYEEGYIYPSRRAAFRAAKRDVNMPMSKHPDDVIRPETALGKLFSLYSRNVRLYVFNFIIAGIAIVYYIREDKKAKYGQHDNSGDQSPHFNAGEPPSKLGAHYYWNDHKD